jgi:YVTN family beta-propeller protein
MTKRPRQIRPHKILLFCCLSTFLFILAAEPSSDNHYISPIAIIANSNGSKLYLAQTTGQSITIFNIPEAKIVTNIALPNPPTGLTLSHDEKTLYVTESSPQGNVYLVNLESNKIVKQIAVGHTPNSPLVSQDKSTLYLCNRFNNNISVIDLSSNKEIKKIPVEREPIAAEITPDGNWILVGNHLPSGAANSDYVTTRVSVISTATNELIRSINLPNGSTNLRGICLSSDGNYAYATHILAHYQLPTTQIDRGWINSNALSIIDVKEKKLINTILLDEVDRGAANPWGVVCSDDGKYICVGHAGTHEISIIDRYAMHGRIEQVSTGNNASDIYSHSENVSHDMSFLVGIRRRIKLHGKGPRGITMVDSKIYVAEYFSDSIGEINLYSDTNLPAKSIPFGPMKTLSEVRKGEIIFHDANYCFQQWQSCASCHPEGRTDGLNWDLLNDGIANPKQTKNLLLSHKTPPAMITGIRPNAETAVRSGFKHINFMVISEQNAAAVDAYLRSLNPVQSPFRVNGLLSESAHRGKKIFQQSGCASCHNGTMFTDLEKYDVSTGIGRESDSLFDTPTLVEIWRTAPYLYDGRATSIREVLTKYNVDDKHGMTSELSDSQLADLIEYILSQ